MMKEYKIVELLKLKDELKSLYDDIISGFLSSSNFSETEAYANLCEESYRLHEEIRALEWDLEYEDFIAETTADEVCEILSEELNTEATFYDNEFFIRDPYDSFEDIQITYYHNTYVEINTDIHLPPDIIKIISKFYRGVIE